MAYVIHVIISSLVTQWGHWNSMWNIRPKGLRICLGLNLKDYNGEDYGRYKTWKLALLHWTVYDFKVDMVEQCDAKENNLYDKSPRNNMIWL